MKQLTKRKQKGFQKVCHCEIVLIIFRVSCHKPFSNKFRSWFDLRYSDLLLSRPAFGLALKGKFKFLPNANPSLLKKPKMNPGSFKISRLWINRRLKREHVIPVCEIRLSRALARQRKSKRSFFFFSIKTVRKMSKKYLPEIVQAQITISFTKWFD